MKLFKYTYHENNSGGVFLTEEEMIVVYATDNEHADMLAEKAGAYFDGVENGHDCGCCGDRWSRAYRPDRNQD